MKRLQRLAAELIAFAGFWMLWDFRVAASLALILIVARAMQEDRPEPARRAPGAVPVLTQPAAAAAPGGRRSEPQP